MQFKLLVRLRDDVRPPNNQPREEPHPNDGHDKCERVEILLVGPHRIWNSQILQENQREEDNVEEALCAIVGHTQTWLLVVYCTHDQLIDLALGNVRWPYVFNILSVLCELLVIRHLVVSKQVRVLL